MLRITCPNFYSRLSSSSSRSGITATSSSLLRRSTFTATTRTTAATPSTSSLLLVAVPALDSRERHIASFISKLNPWAKKKDEVDSQVQPLVYDKESIHYTGKFLGIPTDTLFFYSKVAAIGLTVYMVVWTFFAGYNYLMSFSLQQVGRLGFMAGFWSCAILYTTFIQLKKRYQISPNAVYNQAIATVMKNKEVAEFLGSYPRTGDFRAYHASGGFKLPLLRRIRSGSYELSDLLGTKPQRLQMMLVLKANDREALVTCDVRKMHSRLLSSSYHFHSLAVHLKDTKTKEERSHVLIGRDEDVVYKGLIEQGGGTLFRAKQVLNNSSSASTSSSPRSSTATSEASKPEGKSTDKKE